MKLIEANAKLEKEFKEELNFIERTFEKDEIFII
jgi:hypothetical protein